MKSKTRRNNRIAGDQVVHVGTTKFSRWICEALAVHEALRRLGFAASDIYVGHGPCEIRGQVQPDTLYVQLQAQGKKFTCPVAPVEITQEQLRERWTSAIDWVQTAPDEDLEKVWLTSVVGAAPEAFQALVASLLARGFFLPKLVS